MQLTFERSNATLNFLLSRLYGPSLCGIDLHLIANKAGPISNVKFWECTRSLFRSAIFMNIGINLPASLAAKTEKLVKRVPIPKSAWVRMILAEHVACRSGRSELGEPGEGSSMLEHLTRAGTGRGRSNMRKGGPYATGVSLVALICSLSPLPAAVFDSFTYEVVGDEVVITDYPENATGDVTIPEEIDSKSVTSIGSRAFQGCSGLTSITIPSSVTSIGSRAFRSCSGLTSITIPSSVTEISNSAFQGCSGLTSITIPSGITTIRESLFAECSGLTSITIPSSVTEIEDSAFAYCSGLTSITIPSSVTSIGSDVFAYCSELTSITIPSSVTDIGNSAFQGCSGLTSITIPSSITSIKDSAFEDCSGLTSITIPSSVTEIRDRAFRSCSELTSITIPSSVTDIGDKAFGGCDKLSSAVVLGDAPEVEDDTFESSIVTIYYYKWRSGFSSPTWEGYSAFGIDEITPPADLVYSTNPAIYTSGVAIADNAPSSTGGEVEEYSIAPALPDGLSWDTESGVISGTPTKRKTAADYTVTAINSGGSTTVTLRMAVNFEKHVVILLEGTDGSRDMKVTFNGTGSWSTRGSTSIAFTYNDSGVANSSHESLGGSSREGFEDGRITGGNAINAALSGSFTDGQYVAFATPIAMTADAGPSSFKVIGFLFDDVSNPMLAHGDNITLVTDQPESSLWSFGTEISYTVGASTTFSLDSGIGATFDQAFNRNIYNLDQDTVGTLKIAETAPPADLAYSTNTAIYTKGVEIIANEPSSTGSAVDSYSITPSLPAGLSLDVGSGVISGTPSALSAATDYTVTATNTGGSATVPVSITVNDVAPSALSYAMNPAVYTVGVAITNNTPSSAGGAVVTYSITPSLPAELSLDVGSGVISGTPSALSTATDYTVTATNTGGSATVTLRITVNDVAPVELSYATNPAVYTKGVAITNNTPSSAGGAVVTYSITPSLPAELSLDVGSGVISGTPSALSTATDYTVTATNTGGSATVPVSITVNDVAPVELSYATNPAVYTKGVAITNNTPSSAGGAVVTYSITPSLPAELSLDVGSGVISGTPSALSTATDYTVTATNSGGSATVPVSITVNDVAPVELSYATNPAVYTKGVAITNNTPSSAGGAVVTYSITPSLPAELSLDVGSGVISGTPSALSTATDYTVTATNTGGSATVTLRITVNDVAPVELSYATNPAVYTKGVAIANNTPSSAGGVVVTYSITPSLPAELSLDVGSGVISGTPSALSTATDYTVTATNTGGSATVPVSITVNDVAPVELSYATNPAVYTVGVAIANNTPSSAGGAVVTYSITPSLPAELSLDVGSGVISGTPSALSTATDYTVTATNTGGSATVTLRITVNDVAPVELSYATNPAVYTKGVAITNNTPSSAGGAVVTYSITPSLPAELSLDVGSGVISGTPSALSTATDYTVTATNTGGSATVTLRITVSDVAPVELSYATNPAVYTKGVAITNNTPSSAGGAVVTYSITPSLPAELSLDVGSGVISGTPSALSTATDYTVTATNTGGSATVTLRITVNDVAPVELSYATNPAVYTKGVAITNNTPSSAGGAVVTYSITPSLPAELSLDVGSGVISGTPSALSTATDYTVTATNTGGSATVPVSITVNDVAPVELSYATNPAVYTKGVAITNNTPSSAGGAVVTYSITPSLPAGLSLDVGSGVISGTPSELRAATDYTVTATNTGGSATVTVRITVNDVAPSALSYATNPAVYTKGVAIANNTPSSAGGAVVTYSITPSLPAGLSLDVGSGVISGTPSELRAATDYTVTATNTGGSATVTLRITVNDVAPVELSYATNPAVYTKGVAIANNTPSSAGGAVVSYSITPSLPAELSLDVGSGVISGTPSALSTATDYTVTATNTGGSATVTLRITVNDVAPVELSYATNPAIYTVGVAITDNEPFSAGGTVEAYSITPALPAGLSLDTGSGVISGAPSELSAVRDYTVTATNTGGSATVTLRITVNDVAPSALSYAMNPAVYTVGVAISDNAPSSTGGTVEAYSITPSLPTGLSFDPVSGVISGTPGVSSEVTEYMVTATNSGGSTTAAVSITVNDLAPSALSYAVNPAVYTVGVAISDNEPSSTGGAVVTYSITPSLPTGLSFDLVSGVISGTPGVSSEVTEYTVTATNSGGSTTAVVSITVNDLAPSALGYAMNPAVYTVGVAISDNEPSSTGGAVVTYAIVPSLPTGLSFDPVSGVISGTPGVSSEVTEYTVTATNSGGLTTAVVSITVNDLAPVELSYAMNPAVYTVGVAISDNEPSSTGGAVVSYSIAPVLPVGLSFDAGSGVISGAPAELSEAREYTVTAMNSGGSATVILRITVNDVAPSVLVYTASPGIYPAGVAIANNMPSSTGGAVVAYSLTPPLPAGLSFDTVSGVISGASDVLSEVTDYTVTAINTGGSATVTVPVTVIDAALTDVPPAELSYATNPEIYTMGVVIADNMPSSTGGAVLAYAIAPSLPTGLSFDTKTGVISGVPAELSEAREYMVTVANAGGSTAVTVMITVNAMAPGELNYTTSPGIYTAGVAITDNVPSSTGSAVDSYSITPSLPVGLSFDTKTGVISGMPGELSEAKEHTVTATNSGGSATVTLRITVNDMAPGALAYSVSPGIYPVGVAIADNMPSSTGGAVVAYSITPSLPVGLSFDPVSGVISGAPDALSAVTDYTVTAINSGGSATVTVPITVIDATLTDVAPAELSYATNPAIYTMGVVIADNMPSSTEGVVEAYAIAPSLPVGLSFDTGSGVISGVPAELSEARDYTVTAANAGGSTAVAVRITVNAMVPGELTYSTNPVGYTVGVAITDNAPSSTGGAVVSYSIAPVLPAGLSLDTGSGVISGTPSELSAVRGYMVTAANSGGSATVTLRLTVNDVMPSELSYAMNPAIYTVGVAITDNMPSSTGGVVGAYSIAPVLPVGLSLDTGSGVISGTPAELNAVRDYTVTAANSGGSATVTLRLTVNDVVPSELSYAMNPVGYTVGVAITDNAPSSTGGAVVSYSIAPVLPVGLSLDTGSGVISGTPSELSAVRDHTVTAANSGGSATVTLRLTVNDVVPSELSYAMNPVGYTVGVAITDNAPSSTGGAVVSYSIAPVLPVGLSLDTGSGVISGTPSELSAVRDHTVTAANSGGSATVTLRLTVNDVVPSELSYAMNPVGYTVGVAITDNAPSSTGGAVVSYSIAPVLPVGLSLDTGSGVISGTPSELSAVRDHTVTAANSGGSATVTLRLTVNDVMPSALSYAMNPAIYTVGVAISDNAPSSTGGTVEAYSITPALPAGLSLDTGSGVISGTPSELSAVRDHTVTAANSGGSATVTLRLTVNDVVPSELSYAMNPAIYTVGVAITDNMPSSTGGVVGAYSIAPVLPVGLSLDTGSGVISGTPAELSAVRDHTVTAANSGGSATVTLRLTVNDVMPSELSYAMNPAIYTVGVAISDNAPSSTGGAVVASSITPVLPAGLSFDTGSGVISGTPAELSAVRDYTVTAANSGGSATVTLRLTVNDVMPSELSYAMNPAIYTVGVAITDNAPSSTGGAVVAYSIAPVLPVGLSLDTGSGVISGTPSELSAVRDHTVTATNSGGSATVTLRLTVNDVMPSELSYAMNPAIYTVGVAISDNAPSSTGGTVEAYSIAPVLPAGLSLDTGSGVISGTPAELSAVRDHTVTAANSGGSATVTLRLTVNDVMPSELSYAMNPAIYTVGVAISDNMPSSTGGVVGAYSIAPVLPVGLSLDTGSGVISGTPAELSAVRDYTVTATNSGGSATAVVTITVKDVAPSALVYSASPAIYPVGVVIADNMPSSAGGAVVAYSITPVLPAGLSFDTVSGVISGTPSELSAVTDYTVTAINTGGSTTVTVPITVTDAALPDVAPAELSYATNPAIYTMGVAIADNIPSSTGGVVMAYSIAPSLPAGLSFDPVSGVISGMPLELSEPREYMVTGANSGGSTAVTVMITVKAMAPGELSYSTNPGIYTVGEAITDNEPSSTGGAVVTYAITPSLPTGLSFDPVSGVISGIPLELSEPREYMVTGANSGGSTAVTVMITVKAMAPGELSYSTNPGIYTVGVAITDNEPSSTGGAVVAYSITPSLPAGLSLDPVSGVISGTPDVVSAVTDYTVTATNSGGSATVALRISVKDVAPSALVYSVSPGIYPLGVAIADSMPSSTGGAVVAYSITPSLPAGLSFDPVSGVISGASDVLSEVTDYTVTAINSGGAATVTVPITITDAALTDVAPAELSYATNPGIYTMGVAIADNVPSSTGGAVVAYAMAPSLPEGLSFDTKTGVISGVPAELSEAGEYMVTAANAGGSTAVTVRITVKAMAPGELAYTVNPAIYTVGVAITDNVPSSTGGAVEAYVMAPSLPAGLSFDTKTGVISGMPAELSEAKEYAVTATNSGGSAAVTLRITVKDVAPSALAYPVSPGIYPVGVAVADNMPSSTGGAVVAYSITPVLPAGLSFDPGSGVISGTPSELSAVTDYTVTAINSGGSVTVTVPITVTDAALTDVAPGELSYATNPGIYTMGVAIADNVPSSTGGAVVAYAIAPSLPAGLSFDPVSGVISGVPLELSEARDYTVTAANSGGSTAVTVMITVKAMAPGELTYSTNPGIYTMGVAIADNVPSSTGGAVVAYSIAPSLPVGLSFYPVSGVISGTPDVVSAVTDYTVTATNSGGSATVTLRITVKDVAPSALVYSVSPAIYTVDAVIADNMPSSAGGAVVAYSITPSLPAGLSFDTKTGVISGTPSELSAVTDYTVTAINSGGSATVRVPITVTDAALPDVAPAELSYATNPAIYTMGVAIAENVPSSAGGAVVAYSIAPSLPVGLSFDPVSGVISGVPVEPSEARDYTVTAANAGGSATVTLRITVSTVTDMAPAELSYTTNPAIYTVGFAINRNTPFSKGGVVDSYSITPALPVGLSLDTRTGVISGGPAEPSEARDYMVTATNSRGSTTATLRIMVEDAAPSALSYAMNPAIYTVGVAIAENVPSSTGGAVVAYSITPVLPAGLSLDTGNGVISGTPTEPGEAREYTVTATNSGGSTTVMVRVTVNDMVPSELTYSMNPAIYAVGEAITDNVPSSTGGAVVAYSITPVLPAGLSLDMGSGVISGTPTEPGEAREYTVTATNSGGSTTAVVTITVKGRHPPQYTNSGPFNVAENSVNGTLAGDADANDADGGAKDVGVTYAIQSGNDSVDGDATPAFGLDPDTGVLTVRDQDDLDHETQSSFALVIRATDGDGFTDVIVTIQVDNVPEAPVSTGLTPVYVMIGATDGVIDLATVFSDEEDADLSYSISFNSNTALFTSAGIDEETGRLILDFALNIAGKATLEITATDSDSQSVSVTLMVTVSGDALEEWRRANFSAADLGDPAKEATLWGNSANPDEDLWSNDFEFFFGTDPNSFDEGYPLTYEVHQVGLDGFAVLEFERSKAVPAGVGVVEGSGDLSQWQVVNAPAVVMEDLGDRERVRVSIPLEEQAKQSFVRLVVDLGMN